MPKDSSGTNERRGSTAEVIKHLLKERKQLLQLLLRASSHTADSNAVPDRDLLNEFCQLLVDYIAAAHFGLYERIVEGTERRRGVAELAVKLYPRIEQTTQAALAFNERYDAHRQDINSAELHRELSLLGEELTRRIDYEDRIIRKLEETR